MTNPLTRSKSYFSGQNLAKYHQRKRKRTVTRGDWSCLNILHEHILSAVEWNSTKSGTADYNICTCITIGYTCTTVIWFHPQQRENSRFLLSVVLLSVDEPDQIYGSRIHQFLITAILQKNSIFLVVGSDFFFWSTTADSTWQAGSTTQVKLIGGGLPGVSPAQPLGLKPRTFLRSQNGLYKWIQLCRECRWEH